MQHRLGSDSLIVNESHSVDTDRLLTVLQRLDADRNEAAERAPACISAGGPVTVWVVPTEEERQVARETCALLGRDLAQESS